MAMLPRRVAALHSASYISKAVPIAMVAAWDACLNELVELLIKKNVLQPQEALDAFARASMRSKRLAVKQLASKPWSALQKNRWLAGCEAYPDLAGVEIANGGEPGVKTESGEMRMRRSSFDKGRCLIWAAAGFVLLIAPSLAKASNLPANTLRELFADLNRCIATPKGNIGSELTIVFSLRRDGALLGKPKITFAKLPGDTSDERRFVEALASSFNKCLPIAITDGLGGAIAGRPLSMRFVTKARETNT
jgi:hypothetical protein